MTASASAIGLSYHKAYQRLNQSLLPPPPTLAYLAKHDESAFWNVKDFPSPPQTVRRHEFLDARVELLWAEAFDGFSLRPDLQDVRFPLL